jgi:putative N-acetyltransferase (TIGR04045 family)
MLEATRPFGAPVRAFLSPLVTYGVACESWELEQYWQLRREIFCDELKIFGCAAMERDAHDVRALPIVAIAHSAGSPEAVVGAVRVYAAEGGAWYGGRLGVARDYRVRPQVGAGLIACAVRTASARGCRKVLAHVLASNVAYFERQHFTPMSELDLCGRRHVLMEANVAWFAGSRVCDPEEQAA